MSNGLPKSKSLACADFHFFGFGVRIAVLVSCVYWLAMFTGTHLPRTPWLMLRIGSMPRIDDKLAHFGAYFALTILMCYASTSGNRIRRFAVIGVVAMTYGAFDELTQMFISTRRCDIWDYAADIAGIWIAIGIFVAIGQYRAIKSASWRFQHHPAEPELAIHRSGGPIADQSGQRIHSA